MAEHNEDDPVNINFWIARGYSTRPSNWEEIYLEDLEAEELFPLSNTTETFSNANAGVLNGPFDELRWRNRRDGTRPSNWAEICIQHFDNEEWLLLPIENRNSLLTNSIDDAETEEFWLARGYSRRPSNWEETYPRLLAMEEKFLNMSIHGTQTNQTTNHSDPTSSLSRNNNNNGGSQDLCKVCLDKTLDSIILECAHIATCFTCGQKLKECPICRKRIVRVIRTYKA